MPVRASDRRVQKTRALLQDALITLIADKGFEAITIKELLDKANVGRSTFYLHFDNKDELLHSCFEDFNNRFNRHNTEIFRAAQKEGDEAFYIVSFLRFAEQNHLFFKALMGEHGALQFTKGIYDYAFMYLDGIIKKRNEPSKLKPMRTDMLTHYVTNAFLGLLKWWVGNDMPCAAEEFGQYILHQINANIKEAMSM